MWAAPANARPHLPHRCVSRSHLDSGSSPDLSLGGYFCPQCHAKYTELPVECKVCGKSDNSGQAVSWMIINACSTPSPRPDPGAGPPPGQVLSPPFPPASLHREPCRQSSGGQVTPTHPSLHALRGVFTDIVYPALPAVPTLLTVCAVLTVVSTGAAKLVKGSLKTKL